MPRARVTGPDPNSTSGSSQTLTPLSEALGTEEQLKRRSSKSLSLSLDADSVKEVTARGSGGWGAARALSAAARSCD